MQMYHLLIYSYCYCCLLHYLNIFAIFFIQNLVDLLVVTRGTDLVSLEVEKNLIF